MHFLCARSDDLRWRKSARIHYILREREAPRSVNYFPRQMYDGRVQILKNTRGIWKIKELAKLRGPRANSTLTPAGISKDTLDEEISCLASKKEKLLRGDKSCAEGCNFYKRFDKTRKIKETMQRISQNILSIQINDFQVF